MDSSKSSVDYSGRRVAVNSIVNALGVILPMIVALFAIKFLVFQIGDIRLGLLLICWSVISYFSILNLGVSTALTRFGAEALALQDNDRVAKIFWNSTYQLAFFGVIGCLGLLLLTPWLVSDILRVPETFAEEARNSLYYLAVSFPFILITAGFRGMLEARSEFVVINLIRIPASILNYLIPMAIAFFVVRLDVIVAFLAMNRILFALLHYFAVQKTGNVGGLVKPEGSMVKSLLLFGGWITLNKIVNQFIVQIDRFIIAMFFTLEYVAYYSTPFELVMKLLILGQTFINVIFPSFSAFAATDKGRLGSAVLKSVKFGIIFMTPIVSAIILVAGPFLGWWLTEAYQQQGALVLQLLALAVYINFLAHIPASLLQAINKPKIPAIVNTVELPLNIIILFIFIPWLGINGAALAWLIRAVLDAIILFIFALREVRVPENVSLARIFTISILSALFIAASFIGHEFLSILVNIGWWILLSVCFLALLWFVLFDDYEKSLVRDVVSSITGRKK